jgi:hypothetical protein
MSGVRCVITFGLLVFFGFSEISCDGGTPSSGSDTVENALVQDRASSSNNHPRAQIWVGFNSRDKILRFRSGKSAWGYGVEFNLF